MYNEHVTASAVHATPSIVHVTASAVHITTSPVQCTCDGLRLRMKRASSAHMTASVVPVAAFGDHRAASANRKTALLIMRHTLPQYISGRSPLCSRSKEK